MDEIYQTASIVISSALRMSVPVVLAGVGASFSVRCGVVAFGCEGMMITGAFFGVLGTLLTGDKWLGILFALAGGVLISMLHAFLHVTHKVNATLSGMSVNLLGLGMTELLLQVVWDSNTYSPEIEPFTAYSAPWLANIPFIGPILSRQYIFLYIAVAVVIAAWVFMYKTTFGLRLRMVGENPVAANSVGINTVRYKYFGVGLCGALSGLGGAYLSMAMISVFQNHMTAGRGFIAMVTCNLGNSNPIGAAVAGAFFGFFDALQSMFQGINFPSQILMAVPYLFILLISLVKFGSGRGPAGMGKHFDDE